MRDDTRPSHRLTLSLPSVEFELVKQGLGASVLGSNVSLRLEPPGTVIISSPEQELLVRASEVVKAAGLGFPVGEALGLMNGDKYLLEVPLKAELPQRDKRKQTPSRHRLVSYHGLNLRIIENFTGISYKLSGDTIWILGPFDSAMEASRQVRSIAAGRTRGTIQQYHRGKHGLGVKRHKDQRV